jgi:ABC-type polysaccharide/polyol phosphate export permease
MQTVSDAPATFRSSAQRPGSLESLRTGWREIFSRRRLITYLVRAEIKKQGTDTVLGNVWWILDPLLSLLVYVFVMTVIFGRKQEDFPVFLLAAMIPFKWFTGSVGGSVNSVVAQGGLIKQIQFPKIVLPVVTVTSGLVNLVFGLGVLIVVVAIGYRDHLSLMLLWLPVIAAIQFVLMLGLSLLLSAFTVFYRDIGIIIGHVMRLLFYVAPILWTFGAVNGRGSQLQAALGDTGFAILRFNPVAILMESYRTAVYGATNADGIHWHHSGWGDMDVESLFFVLAFSLVVLVLGVILFKRLEPAFAKVL